MTDNMQLSDIRKVTLYWIKAGSPTSHLMAASDVERFVEASKRLHWKPGKNPHNGEETAHIWKITVCEMETRGPFWWSTPHLQNNYDPDGAKIIDGGTEKAVFVDAEIVNRWDAEQAEEEARFYRERERVAKESATAADCPT